MYHCCIRFYLVGIQRKAFEIMKGIVPLEHFTHEFDEGEEPDQSALAKADVILADLDGMDARDILHKLLKGKRANAELVLLADKKQMEEISDSLAEVTDVWTLPMKIGRAHV